MSATTLGSSLSPRGRLTPAVAANRAQRSQDGHRAEHYQPLRSRCCVPEHAESRLRDGDLRERKHLIYPAAGNHPSLRDRRFVLGRARSTTHRRIGFAAPTTIASRLTTWRPSAAHAVATTEPAPTSGSARTGTTRRTCSRPFSRATHFQITQSRLNLLSSELHSFKDASNTVRTGRSTATARSAGYGG